MGCNSVYNNILTTMEYRDESIILRIKDIMKEKGLSSQTELSRAVGVQQSSISFMFKLTRSAIPLVDAICKTYGVSKQWLLSGTGIKYVQVEKVIKDINLSDLKPTASNEKSTELIRQLNELYTRHQALMKEEQEIMKMMLEINKQLLLSGIDIAG